MDPDEKAIQDRIIIQYRQDVDQLKYALARANAQAAVKDQLVAELAEKGAQSPVEGPKLPTHYERLMARIDKLVLGSKLR